MVMTLPRRSYRLTVSTAFALMIVGVFPALSPSAFAQTGSMGKPPPTPTPPPWPLPSSQAMELEALPSIINPGDDQVQLPVRDQNSIALANQGFTATISLSKMFSIGYASLQVQLDSTVGAMTKTRRLTIRLTPVDRHLPSTRAMTMDFPMEFPQGSSKASLSQAFPKWTVGNSYRVDVIEDGSVLDGYTESIGLPWPRWANRSSSDALTNQLFVQCFSFGDHQDIPKTSSELLLDHREMSWLLQVGEDDDVPKDWRLMRDINCMIVSEERLGNLKRLPTIRDWIMMGGTLVVLGSDDPEQLSQTLDLALPQSVEQQQEYESAILYTGNLARGRETVWSNWIKSAEQLERITELERTGPMGQASSASSQERLEYQPSPIPNVLTHGLVAGTAAERLQVSKDYLQQFREDAKEFEEAWNQGFEKQVGGGLVIGLPANGLNTSHGVIELCDRIGFRRSSILQRGVDPVLGDSRRRRWLIPGVAQPPVYTFIGILTLFVILVGPLAYRWTTRGHRSHLMFFIAPVLALITTVSMFSYSIVADGFGTTMRVRQLTWIDVKSGDAVERTRSTLFSGISPRNGLKFDPHAEVMLYPDERQLGWAAMPQDIREVRHRVLLDSEQQTFSSSWLPSRTQNQFVNHQVRRGLGTVRFVDLKPFDTSATNLSGASKTSVVSSLPFDLQDVFVRSVDGRYWMLDQLKAGETADMNWVMDVRVATKGLGDLYNRHRPIGVTTESSGRRSRRNRLRDLVIYINREISQDRPPVTDGAIEDWLGENLFTKGVLPPGTFVAVSEVSPDAIPVENASTVESVRYVMGTIQ